jgi:hypothetical protein
MSSILPIESGEEVTSHLVHGLISDPETSVGNINVVAEANTSLLDIVTHADGSICALVNLNNSSILKRSSRLTSLVEVSFDGQEVLGRPLSHKMIHKVQRLLNAVVERDPVFEITLKSRNLNLGSFANCDKKLAAFASSPTSRSFALVKVDSETSLATFHKSRTPCQLLPIEEPHVELVDFQGIASSGMRPDLLHDGADLVRVGRDENL